VVVELVHAATLVHDDIMDGAEMRRGQRTANAKWGNSISVLLGDCLFAHALKLSTTFPDGEISRRIAQAASEVCSGEIIQTQRRFDLKLPVSDYTRIIEMKTAALFAAASELGAFINQASPEIISAMKDFGMKLGTAYQIYDDCLDIAGDEKTAGKTLGTDLRKGKLTLPILLLLDGATAKQRERLSEIILGGKEEELSTLAQTTKALGALKGAVRTAQDQVDEANRALDILPANRYRDGLQNLCDSLKEMVGKLAG
jgi:octaprenyl-diphosphate synthase